MSSNIRIAAVEQTQAIQFFNFPAGQGSGNAADNSVPLVNRKQTLLRVVVDARRNDESVPLPSTVDGIVWAFNPVTSGGGVYRSVSGPVAAREASTIKRAQGGQTLDFLIPWSVCQEQVLCQIVIFDPANRSSPNTETRFITLDFIDVPPLSLHSVLIHYTGVDFFDKPVEARTTPLDVLAVADYLLRIFPVSDFDFDGCEILQWNAKLAVKSNFYALKAAVDNLRAMSGANGVYAALIPPEAGCGGVCGLGGGGSALFFAEDSLQQRSAAHEIGHALGRPHAPGCLPANEAGDQSYPQYDGFPRASIGEVGVDQRGLMLFDPRTTSDYMSYCLPSWTSPYTYSQLLATLRRGSFSPQAPERELGRPQRADYHYINFRVDARAAADARVKVGSAFHIPRPRPRLSAQSAGVSVELLDQHGNHLYDTAAETDPSVERNPPFQYFRAYFPHYAELRRIRIVGCDAILAEYELAREAPRLSEVRIERGANRIHVRWEGSAVEGAVPCLEYGVRFSADGEKWRAVAAAITEEEVVLDTTLLPGGERCRIQVVASAGFRTTVRETPVFSLPRKPRLAYIASPKPGEEFEFGTPILFSGTPFSPDFGVGRPDEIAWDSLSAGVLGTGQQMVATALPVGHHWVTLRAPDGMGGLATRSVAFRVLPAKGCKPTGPAPIPCERLQPPCDCR